MDFNILQHLAQGRHYLVCEDFENSRKINKERLGLLKHECQHVQYGALGGR